jgi:hypothetical protein
LEVWNSWKNNRGMKWCKQVMDPTSFPKDHALSTTTRTNPLKKAFCWNAGGVPGHTQWWSNVESTIESYATEGILPRMCYHWLSHIGGFNSDKMKVRGKSSVGVGIFTKYSQCLRSSSRGLAAAWA